MKMRSIVFEMAVLIMSLSLVFTGCGGSDTYTAVALIVPVATFTSTFPSESGATATSPLTFISGSKDDLYYKVMDLYNYSSYRIDAETGLSFSEVESALYYLCYTPTSLVNEDVPLLLNELKSKGYGVAYKGGGGQIYIVAAMKE